MKLFIFTIVLDGMPWITHHLPVFNSLKLDWHWVIVEGVAEPVKDTSWCKTIYPRLSQDGTTEFLDSLRAHPRISVLRRESWPGKTAMCNAALELLDDGNDADETNRVLMQVDSDEIWTAQQIERIQKQFVLHHPTMQRMDFRCNFWLGPAIKIISGSYANADHEWRRAWRYRSGQRFVCHEPPLMDSEGPEGPGGWIMGNVETDALGLRFEHYAYATEKQVQFKSQYYGYDVSRWGELQRNRERPVRVKDYLPWVSDDCMADRPGGLSC